MILADTAIWIDHLRSGDERLVTALNAGVVLIHPFVIGEIALGSLRRRQEVLADLQRLPHAPVATYGEVLTLIDRQGLDGAGIGYVDAHLLASARLALGARLWTRDRKLSALATRLGVGV